MVIKDIYNLFDKSDCLMILEKLYNYSFSDSIIHSNDKINDNDEKIILEYKNFMMRIFQSNIYLGLNTFTTESFTQILVC